MCKWYWVLNYVRKLHVYNWSYISTGTFILVWYAHVCFWKRCLFSQWHLLVLLTQCKSRQITKGQDEPWRPGAPFTNMDKLLIPIWISYYMPIYSEVQTSRNPHIQTDIQTSKQTILSNACIRAYLYSNITRYQIQCKCSSCIFMLQTYRLTSPAESPVYE